MSKIGLDTLGLTGTKQHWNPSPAVTVEMALERKEGKLAARGAFHVITAPFTGRSPDDKFIVKEPSSENNVWWGKVNRPISEAHYTALKRDMIDYLNGRELFVRDVYACADPRYKMNVRLVSENAWHTLFAHNMFIRPDKDELETFEPNFTILHAPEFHPDPEKHGTRKPASGPTAAILLNFAERTVLIAGTRYAGEIKKSIFTALNYYLPLQGVLSMHCSANIGDRGDTALFFGLSGTGKTTLSADPHRRLIGDDEHGWSDDGVFNFEGGCYAKVIHLSPSAEPQIYACTRKFGTILENVAYDPVTRRIDLDDETRTENTRASYPLEFIENAVPEKRAGHPKNIILLTCDASGVMPPIAKLTPDQALYQFISGYTSKVGGTEVGLGKEPEITFSACFGGPFMVHHPSVYADLLKRKIERYGVNCWLVNTGWIGGPYGVGKRISIAYTRALLNAALSGQLLNEDYVTDPVFGFAVPKHCAGVPDSILRPVESWPDPAQYAVRYKQLAYRFIENFKRFEAGCPPEIVQAGPTV
jgi:phosphoenolpyruvate carboxykinase (ATP)